MRLPGVNAVRAAEGFDLAAGPVGTVDRVEVLGPATDLDGYLTGALNRPFPDDDPFPVRPFVQPQGDEAWLGLAYDHWLADSVAIRSVMRRWIATCHDEPLPPLRHLQVRPPRKLNPDRDWAMVQRMRRCRRLPRGHANGDACYIRWPLPDGLCKALVASAKRRKAKVNDLFLAATAFVAHRHVPSDGSPRRSEVAVGAIVDTRRYVAAEHRDDFGLLLGFVRVVLRAEDLGKVQDTLAAVVPQTAMAMAKQDPLRGWATMSGGLLAARLLQPDDLREFYRKRMPLLAGVSNVNLDATPFGPMYPHRLAEYVRVSPLGPTMPLVFTPTTLGGELTLGLTYRTAALDAAAAEKCAEAFVEALEKLA